MKKTIHQFHANVASRDAIGENMFAIQKELRRLGYDSEVFCLTCSDDIRDRVTRLDLDKPGFSPDQVLIFHYSIGFSGLDKALSLPAKKILVYHNITPPEFLDDFSPMIANYCREGRQELLKFKGKVDLVVGDSEYNVQELRQMGFQGGTAVPILFDFKKFATPPDPDILKKYGGDGWVNWLFVGRVFPNKKQEDIVKAFYYYKKYMNPSSRLILVGGYKDLRVYYEYLLHFVDSLGVKDVIITGSVPESELVAYYKIANLFISMSEHEGFCVPLIEAIYSGIPIMAYNSSAVPETLGDAGVLIKEKRFPEIAELARYILENGELRNKLIENQKKRLQIFSTEAVLQKWQQVLNGVL